MAHTFLLVEDSDEDFAAFCRAVHQAGWDKVNIKRCVNGAEALDYLYGRGQFAETIQSSTSALILLDLNMPGIDGRMVLSRIKSDARLRVLPVIIFSTSSNPRDVQECYALGANSYLVKNADYDGFKRTIRLLCEYWLTIDTYANTMER